MGNQMGEAMDSAFNIMCNVRVVGKDMWQGSSEVDIQISWHCSLWFSFLRRCSVLLNYKTFLK